MPAQTKARRGRRGASAVVRTWVDLFAEHNLLTWASAIAFQVLVALIPLTLLALGILGALGEQSVRRKQIAPGIHKRLPRNTFDAVNYAADRILAHGTAALLLVAAVVAIWEISGSVRGVMGALNRIYDTKDERTARRRFATSYSLAIASGCCFVGAILALALAKHLGGSLHALISAGRWLVVVILLSAAVASLVRFAPSKPRSQGWVSLGSGFIVVAWIVATLIFRWWVTSVASFRSAWGSFVAVFVLTTYLYVSAIIFLVGVQADELVRKDVTAGERGILDRLRAALG